MYILLTLQIFIFWILYPPFPHNLPNQYKSTQFSRYGQYQQTPLLGNLTPINITAILQEQKQIQLEIVKVIEAFKVCISIMHDASHLHCDLFCLKCTIFIKNNESFSSAPCVTIQKTQPCSLVRWNLLVVSEQGVSSPFCI